MAPARRAHFASATPRLYVRKVDNFKHALDPDHVRAALREKNGEILKLKSNGKAFDHLLETRNVMQGAYDSIPILKKYLGDPCLTRAQRDAVELELGELSRLVDQAEDILREPAGSSRK